MKIFSGLLLLAVFFINVAAAEPAAPGSRAEMEIPVLSIKLSNDGTGIIKGPTCDQCDFKIVKITANTKAFANRVSVNISRAGDRAGKPVFIQFDTRTAEVLAIYWSE